jgi:hypothetical protein
VLRSIRVLPVPVGLSNKENLIFGSWRVLYKEDIKRYCGGYGVYGKYLKEVREGEVDIYVMKMK